MTRLWEILKFELAYQLTRVSTRIYFAISLGFALALTYTIIADARNDGYFFNAPIVTSLITIWASMLALLVTAGVAGDSATRDLQVRIDSLLYTTPLRKASYLGGRFLGSFAVIALLLVAVLIGLLLATRLPGIERQILGPFRADAYLRSYFIFALPNAFVSAAVLFSLAAISRRAITAYAGAAVLFFAGFFSEGIVGEHLGHWRLAKLLDPLGYTPLHALWRSYNPLQKNTLAGVDAAMVSNRLLWLGVAVIVLAFAYFRFRFAHHTGGGGWRRAAPVDEAPATRWTGITVPAARRVFSVSTRMRQLLAIATRSFRGLVTSRGWWIVPVLAVIFVFTAPELLEVELGTPGAATTARVAAILGVSENVQLIVLLIALSAGELIWRERDTRMNVIADVTPVPEWLSVIGKFLGLALMLAAAQLVFLLAGVGVQATAGFHRFDIALYLQILFGFQLTGYLLFAALGFVVHVVVNQKYVANVLIMLAFVATKIAPEIGIEHNLLLYGGAPEWSYSEMGGFGPQVGPWLWFTFYWAGWALLFGVAVCLFWIRGEERGLRPRLALARRRLTRWPAAAGATALVIVAGAGAFVFYNTNVLNPYSTDAEIEQQRAEYERRYRKHAAVPQPVLAATKLQVDFYPKRGEATIRGTYRLENRSGAIIDVIHLATHSGVKTHNVSFDRPSRTTLSDERLGHRMYTLGQPLRPGLVKPRGAYAISNCIRTDSPGRNGDAERFVDRASRRPDA